MGWPHWGGGGSDSKMGVSLASWRTGLAAWRVWVSFVERVGQHKRVGGSSLRSGWVIIMEWGAASWGRSVILVEGVGQAHVGAASASCRGWVSLMERLGHHHGLDGLVGFIH